MPQRQLELSDLKTIIISTMGMLIDPIAIVLSLLALFAFFGIPMDGDYFSMMITTFLLVLLVFRKPDLAESQINGELRAQINNMLLSWGIVISILMLLGYSTEYFRFYSWKVMATWFVLSPLAVTVFRRFARWILQKLLDTNQSAQSVVIAGVAPNSRQLAQFMLSDPHLCMKFVGFFDDRSWLRIGGLTDDQFLGSLSALPDYVRKHHIDHVYIALPMTNETRIVSLVHQLHDTTASVHFLPDLFTLEPVQVRVDDIHGIPVVAVYETPFQGFDGLLKRLSDIVISLLVLLITFPLMLIIPLGIKLDSPGPVIFRQRRYGLAGKVFFVHKFRTMTVCEDGPNIRQATHDDSRITSLGEFLRRYHLDELPQFINVLEGKMSVVGPRPHAVAHNEMYRNLIKGYMVRHKVKPGLTGWAQVNGLHGETDTLQKMKKRVDYDLNYVRHWSLGLDAKILFMTVKLLLTKQDSEVVGLSKVKP